METTIDPISQDLGRIMNDVVRFSTNPEIAKACHSLLIAANELLCLRHDEALRKEDMRHITSALDWSEKAQITLTDLAVDLELP